MMKKEKATIHDIAKKLNITASTVSRALKDHPRISETTKQAVHKTAIKLNYQPNHIAAALRNGKSNIIGIIVPTNCPIFSTLSIKSASRYKPDNLLHIKSLGG